jgi:hypothetical protein
VAGDALHGRRRRDAQPASATRMPRIAGAPATCAAALALRAARYAAASRAFLELGAQRDERPLGFRAARRRVRPGPPRT